MLDDVHGLECDISGGEDWGTFVQCTAGKPFASQYVFAKKDLDDDRMGESLTLAQVKALIGRTKLTAVDVYPSDR